MRAAVRGIWAAGVVTLCALPSAALNVWPKVPQLVSGAATGSDVAFVILVTVSVLLMAAVPFAAKKASNIGWKALFWTFGLALATLNYTIAVANVGKLRDLDAGPLRELVHRHAGLDSRIARLTNSRKQLPQTAPAVDQAMLDAANQAVELANDARIRECDSGNAFNCRKRVADLAAATEQRAPLLALKATADQIKVLETEIGALEAKKAALPPPPKDVDAPAARLSKVLGRVIDLGDNPVEATADILINGMSAFAELIALLGPVVLLTAMLSTGQDRAPRPRWRWSWRRSTTAMASAPAAGPAGVAPTPATPAPRKKPNKIKAAGVRELGSVREWKESRTVARPGSKVKPGDAYAAYKDWCAEQGKEPVSLTAFGTIMKGELGVLYEEKNKRGFYLDLALVGALKLVATGTASVAALVRT